MKVDPPASGPVATTHVDGRVSPPPVTTQYTAADLVERDSCKLYEFIWFRIMILLIYLLSLAVSADALYTFPYERATSELTAFFGPDFLEYFTWFCLDLLIVWTFVLVTLRMQDMEPDEPSLHCLRWRMSMSARTSTAMLVVTMFVFLGASVAYDVVTFYRPSVWYTK